MDKIYSLKEYPATIISQQNKGWFKRYAIVREKFKEVLLANPINTMRFRPSLNGFLTSHIFLIGGQGLRSVEFYSIKTDKWSEAPDLLEGRLSHSSC